MARPASMPGLGLLTAALMFLADRISKYILIERVMRPPGMGETPFFTDKQIEFLPIFNLRMAWNYGISFSLFNSGGATHLFVLLAMQITITVVLVWYMWRLQSSWMQIAAGLIVGGALGNILDRMIYGGAVADFFDFHLGEWHFATFNVADSCISIGVALWLLDAVRSASHHAPAPEAQRQQKD
jgi:signal peptidase II